MAISYVGGIGGKLTASTGSLSLTSLTGGSASAPAAGDIVVVYYGGGGTTNFSASLTCSGDNSGAYTAAATAQYANDTYDTNISAWYKVQGATPDTQINLGGLTYSTVYGNAVSVMVFRGVNTTTPLGGVTPVVGTITNASTLSFAAITPTTAGSWVIFGGGNCQSSTGAAITLPSAAHSIRTKTDGSTSDFCAAVGSYESWTSGSYTPTTATGGTTNTSCSAARIEFVLAPQPAANYTVTANNGSYSVTGQTATIQKTRIVSAAAGSYSVTGQAATLKHNSILVAASGSYAVTGQTASVSHNRVLSASAGSYSIDGQIADITWDTGPGTVAHLLMEDGSYLLQEDYSAINLEPTDYIVYADYGIYEVTGEAATITHNKIVTAGYGAYSVTGQAATIQKTRIVTADYGTYTVNGQDAGIYRSRVLPTEYGSYTVNGQSASLLKDNLLIANTGAYTVDGQSADIAIGGTPAASGDVWIKLRSFTERRRF